MYSSLLGVCPESLLLDNDVLGATLRAVRGIEVNEKTLGFDDLAEVCLGEKGHYLGSDHTLSVMQSEYIYPEVGNRFSPTLWEQADKPLAIDSAIRRRDTLLANYVPDHISPAVDAEIRAKFPIRLQLEDLLKTA
jgi:trimethylamine--corrinoid protein Co-methyltransferase